MVLGDSANCQWNHWPACRTPCASVRRLVARLEIQQQADTKRKEPQIKAEVIPATKPSSPCSTRASRRTRTSGSSSSSRPPPTSTLPSTSTAKADLDIYVKHREAAFEAFGEAACFMLYRPP